VKLPAGRWSFAAKFLITALALVCVPKVVVALSTPVHHFTLLWPVTGISLLFGYYWGRPALAGMVLAALIYNSTSDWQWFSMLSWTGTQKFAAADAAVLLAVCLTSVLQVALAARILRSRMPAIRDGSMSASDWVSLFLLAGPATCLLRTLILAVILGWITLPPRSEDLVFACASWVSTTLSVCMAVPVIVIRELRTNMPRLAQNRLRNPWIAFAFVAFPAMALAGYLGLQQVHHEQQRVDVLGVTFRNEVQTGLDAVEQKLMLLRAFYRADADVSPRQFDQFAGELLGNSPLLLGLGWAGQVTDEVRPQVEAALSDERGRVTPLTQLDDQGALTPASHRDEYWPLLRIVPEMRKAMLGFDLASEPNRRKALLQSRNGGLTASARAVSAGVGGERVPAVFLYLATSNPRGVVVAPLKIETLLEGGNPGRQLLAEGHGVLLSNADGEVLAQMPTESKAARETDPNFEQKLTLKIGAGSWYLNVTTTKASLPYLSAPLWWIGQTLPQLLCVLFGLFLALVASNDRKIFQLERYYAGYVEGLGRSAHSQSTAGRYDAAIEQAWNDRAFEPWFEPIVDIRSGDIHGAEALLRWPGAPEGLTTYDIIEWAERKNLIGDVDRRILSSTLQAVAGWPLARLPSFAISVNVSASEMQNPQWAERVLHELARHRVSGRNLCVEITEGVLIRSDSVVLDQLAELRSAGVRIALDDFGTGYSSIAYLRQLPVDRIKLDRSFVSDLASDDKARRIVASIVALGRTLDIDLVAEAVEDSHTVKVLRELGCPLAQGWYFSSTISSQAMRDLLNAQLSAVGPAVLSAARR
jgi:EAL domain-containing protein (putative c-di-GMP-specific phosphodiesterase class I)